MYDNYVYIYILIWTDDCKKYILEVFFSLFIMLNLKIDFCVYLSLDILH